MKNRNLLLLFSLFLVIALTLAACTGAAEEPTTAAPTEEAMEEAAPTEEAM
ncbi:MAG: BMP family ABC transporter substrate-binding protein, partial [Anaerolineae bacterium]|nr:BMP family ABC transporter substrate-binding protein [Anaerolineae bacterium]